MIKRGIKKKHDSASYDGHWSRHVQAWDSASRIYVYTSIWPSCCREKGYNPVKCGGGGAYYFSIFRLAVINIPGEAPGASAWPVKTLKPEHCRKHCCSLISLTGYLYSQALSPSPERAWRWRRQHTHTAARPNLPADKSVVRMMEEKEQICITLKRPFPLSHHLPPLSPSMWARAPGD